MKKNTDLFLALEKGQIASIDKHFRDMGMKELYSGNRILLEGLDPYDETMYLMLNSDVDEKVKQKKYLSGFEHFLLVGYQEVLKGERLMKPEEEMQDFDPLAMNRMLIEKSGLFDTSFYLSRYEDIKNGSMEPLEHYLMFGAKELRDPSETFSTGYYLSQYPEVLHSGINPLVHYILAGKQQNRKTMGYNVNNVSIEPLPLPLVSQPLEKIDLKIAVVIHAFYIDVLEDIIGSIDNIFPRPDLFISVSEDTNVEEIETFLEEKGYKNFMIKPVQNRGRDVAPFLVEFSEALQSYDVCCKIHGKKSLYGGSEQTNWRNHLYHNLLGSKEIVDDILSAFVENEKLGLLFSDNYGMIPYWGYTWLTNKEVARGLLQRLHLTQLNPILDQTYIDYPAGTMFWFRPSAISQILDSDIGYEDFPEEPIGNDGTIAHGLERLFAYVTRLNGYDYIEQNRKRMQYTKNVTHKNFNQHKAKTLETAKNIVKEKECVIFDIFDTLVTRTIFYPDNLFRIMEEKFDTKFSTRSDFMKVRKETEYKLRISETYTGDVSYEDIYDHIHLHSDYTPEMVDYLRSMDFDYEMKTLIPKPDTIALLQYAYDNDIDILFVSDMYLTTEQVMAILKKHNIPFKKENLFVSSDTGYRKDNTTVWKYLVDSKRIDPSRTLMIGDSEVSDAKLPGDFGIGTFHVLSERNAFFESPFGKAFRQQFGEVSETEMLLMGPVVNQLFSSAFELSETVLKFSKKCSPYTFGYTALAPFFYLFVNNVYRKFSDKRIFFLARDGYFLQKTYEQFLQTKQLEPEGREYYLQISRRAMLGAIIKNEDNLKNMIMDLGNYEGMFSSMLYSRVGLSESFLAESGIEDFEIVDNNGLDKAYILLVEHIDLINKHAEGEHRAYLAYLDSIGFFEENEDVLIDLGYSGTIQNYLHQLTEKKLTGEYFVTTEKVKRIENENIRLHGYFADGIDLADNCNTVYKYALVLEAFLTSDKGQLINFKDEKGKPVPHYKEKHASIEVQNKIMEGIKDYIAALSIVPPDFIDIESERMKDISLFTFEYMIRNRLLDDEVLGILQLEDDFTGNKELDIMTVFAQRGI
ncbi:rhamnan synthesis F family protein [Sulfurovum lithotrophicum]|uniref:rhamnan synthesis F family protein n=1 Tax=Sulfurovum lithotrophicum TaxID=206403 RepID=UPI0014700A40|nr:rhamnan synthesis F family protein [Sulfurovum lithotrophicum]